MNYQSDDVSSLPQRAVAAAKGVVSIVGVAVAIGAAQTSAHAQETSTTLPTIQVEGVTERGTGPVEGYQAKQSVTATKTDTPLLETPQSISVVPKDQIQDQQAQSMPQALRYTPGVSLDAYSANSKFDPVYVRGFLADQFLDGLKLPVDPGLQWAVPRVEPYGLERIEVLKGPSSGLYGQTNPGGFINMVSKRPQDTPHFEIEGQYGSFDRFQGAFDFGGPIDKDGHFLYRVVGLVRDADSQIDYQQDNKLFIAPSFTWRPNLDTSLTIQANLQRIQNRGYQQYVPGQGSLLPNPVAGRIPYSRYFGEPSVDGVKDEQVMFGYLFEHRLNDVFQFRQNFRYTMVNTDTSAYRGEGLQADMRTLNRSINYIKSSAYNLTLDNHLQADFATGPLKHKLLLGADYSYLNSHADYRSAGLAPIDIIDPVYGAYVPPASTLPPASLSDSELKQFGVYLQDQIKFDRFTLSLTGRQDRAKTDLASYAFFPTPGFHHNDDSAFTGRVGLNYLFDFGLSPYANYSTSFKPVSGSDRLGQPFKPTTGDGWETGVKYQPTGMNMLFTAAYFDFTQQNVLTADPVNTVFSIQTGEVRMKGYEFEMRGNITRELQVIGSVSHLNPKVTESTNGDVGKTVPYVALNSASLWSKYSWLDGSLAGLGVGAGVRYVGKLYGNPGNTITVDPYTLVDAMVSYDFGYLRPDMKGWKAQLNASNLFDKYYVTNCFGGLAYCTYGQGRTIMLTLKYSWKPDAKTVQ